VRFSESSAVSVLTITPQRTLDTATGTGLPTGEYLVTYMVAMANSYTLQVSSSVIATASQ
jgi:hypothetical protein